MVAQLKHMPVESALNQLKVVFDVAENFSSEARGLLYDELASACEELHPDVSDELRNIILQEFEETFVVNLGDADSQGRVCYEIIRSDSPLAVPFAGIRADGRMLTMFAQLRLIHRMLSVHDSLDDVSALLACAVVLPDVDSTDFTALNVNEKKEVVDSYFSCINYFRELVNGFSRDRDRKSIVVQRLEQIIEMNKTLAKFLGIARNYVPPACQFFHAAKAPAIKRPKQKGKGKGGKGKKRKSKGDDEESEDDPKPKGKKKDEEDNSDDDFVSKAIVPADLSLYREFFRDLDMNVFVILNCPLRINNEETDGVMITGETMKFLLTDYAAKLEAMFAVRAPSPFRKAEAPTTVVETTRSAKYCIKLVALLRFQLDSVVDYTKDLVTGCDGVHDAHGMFPPGSAEIKECCTLLLRCLYLLMAWPGFRYSQNKALKEDLLARLNKQKVGSSSGVNHVGTAFDTLVAMADGIVHLPGAVALLKLLKELNSFNPTTRQNKTINQVSKAFVRRAWFTLAGEEERLSPRFNEHIEALLTFYAQSLPTENRLKHVTELVKSVALEQEEMEAGDSLPSFANVFKQNFHVMYKTLCESLTEVLKLAKKTSDWARLADALSSMTNILQHLKNWKNLKHFTKLCNDFLTVLLQRGKGMDMLEKSPTEAVNTLKTIQITTRYVHRVINDAKAKKDMRLSALIPLVRRNNEKLIMRVKAMCATTPEAFSSGNLRNKNLAGEEILSQETEAFDTPALEGMDSDMEDEPAENEDNEDDDATDSDISTTI